MGIREFRLKLSATPSNRDRFAAAIKTDDRPVVKECDWLLAPAAWPPATTRCLMALVRIDFYKAVYSFSCQAQTRFVLSGESLVRKHS
jgi:hypothetical protein